MQKKRGERSITDTVSHDGRIFRQFPQNLGTIFENDTVEKKNIFWIQELVSANGLLSEIDRIQQLPVWYFVCHTFLIMADLHQIIVDFIHVPLHKWIYPIIF